MSECGDEEFPGEVHCDVAFRLTDDNELQLNFTARVYKKATPINLTTHPYFNLAGQVSKGIALIVVKTIQSEGKFERTE